MSGKNDGNKGGKKSKGEVVVLRRLPGPLAPWRLSLVVALAAATTGMPLLRAASSGEQLDYALLRSFGIAFLAWIALGKINKVLGQVEPGQAPAASSERLATVSEWKEPEPSAGQLAADRSGRAA